MISPELVITGGARTAMAEYVGTPGGGAFKDLSAMELAGVTARAALERSKAKAEWIDHVVIGNAMQTSSDAIYGARHVGLKAGVPIETPALTVNRLCGSGIESVASGARLILNGEASMVLAGGMENMSQAPHVLRGGRSGFRFGSAPALEDSLMVALMDPMCGLFMAQTAEKCATKYGITRTAQDEFALRSHREGVRAVKSGIFKEEIVPVPVKKGRESVPFDTDDHIKPETTIEALAKLSPAFGKEGTVTAGNASGIVDGAAALVITTRARAQDHGMPVLARIVGWAAVGVEPSMMGMGPAPAIRKVLDRHGLKLEQVDLFEINEAFAAQYLAVEKELGLDRAKVNVNGGAVALGHPLGATGTRLLLTLAMELKRRTKRYGIASACIGGGQGIAMLLDAGS
ncbi:MAG: acetyl-CoA C-acetyltransferase [Planctomycetes bacterium]|nr:acetyl-CoA C-acetyltransferase [Planctomycetota bacterium]